MIVLVVSAYNLQVLGLIASSEELCLADSAVENTS